MSTSPLTAGGLILDMAGAVLLASSLIMKKPAEARRETESYYGGNPFVYLSLVRQSADAWVGAALLLLGFTAQFADNVIADDRPEWVCLRVTAAAAAIIALAAGVSLPFVIRPFFVRRAIEHSLVFLWSRYQREYKDEPNEAVRHWWTAVDTWGRHLIGLRRDRESLNAYGRRMLGKRRWARLAAGKSAPADYVPPPASDGA